MLKQLTQSPIQRHASADARPWQPAPARCAEPDGWRLRVLSYNMQVGLETTQYGHYLSRSWRHALPGMGMHRRLDQMAEMFCHFDLVALQEADAGSLRTQFTNQVEYLAQRAGFAHWGLSITRDFKPVARHALAYLSRHAPVHIDEYLLPSRLPGRRALRVQLGPDAGGLQVLVAHLSLGRGAQRRQLEYLNQLVPVEGPGLLMGDLNCAAATLLAHLRSSNSRLHLPNESPLTFPSWRPTRSLDYILHTPELILHRLQALPYAVSDHLPLAAEVSLCR